MSTQTKKTYSEKLKDPRWQKKRLEILQRDKWKCKYCNDGETTLHVHHLKYTVELPHNEPNENLITCCEHCHRIVEYYKDFTVIKMKKFNCSQGKLFIVQCDNGIIYFDIFCLPSGAIEEFSEFDEDLIIGLGKFFKRG